MSKGTNEFTNGNYANAEQYFTEALAWAEEHGSQDQVVTVLGYLGRAFDEEGKNDHAELAFKRRISIAETRNLDVATRVETFLALAIFYSKHRRCDELRQILDTLESSDSSLKSSREYGETVTLISDLSRLHC